jgi:hypothetical protein
MFFLSDNVGVNSSAFGFKFKVLENEEYIDLREYIAGGWRKLHNEELHNAYCSLNIIRIVMSRRMKWASHVARMR